MTQTTQARPSVVVAVLGASVLFGGAVFASRGLASAVFSRVGLGEVG